jgi:pimeloyl-ACP methyl ester carboxylesterase
MATVKMIVVYGLGCNRFEHGVKERRIHLNRIRNVDVIDTVEVMCNTIDSKSMTYDIWKRLRNQELESTPFVRHVAMDVAATIERQQSVILLGHSYGGSVVSRVGMLLNDHGKYLQIGTFGSIFVPPPDESLDIRHYMYANDIAAVCHKRSASYENLIMLDPRYKRNPVFSHMDYDHLIDRVAMHGSLDALPSS